MRIGINLLALRPNVSGGIEFYIRNLLESLSEIGTKHDYFLFTNRDNYATFNFPAPNFTLVACNVAAMPQYKRVAYEQFRLPWLIRQYKLDLFHSPAYTFPILTSVPGLVTICDMLYKVYPDWIGQPKLAFWKIFVPLSVKRCQTVLTISNTAKTDIITYLGVPAEKVIATPLALDMQRFATYQADKAVDLATIETQYGIKPPYILCVGGVGLHKNSQALLHAFAQLPSKFDDVQIVITGNNYGSKQMLQTLSAELGIKENLILPGYVSNEDLPKLYANATLYTSASLFEGFGLTTLEAMAFGTPVIVSNRASLPEVAGEASIVIDPDDLTAYTNALARVLDSAELRTTMIQQGYQHIKKFSWHTLGQQTLQAYEQLLDKPRKTYHPAPSANS